MAKGQDNGKALTEYVVLQGLDLTSAVGELGKLGISGRADYMVWLPVLNQTKAQGPDGEVRVFTAQSKTAAIRQHTGDGADVLEGVWKAVPLSSWKGGERTKRVTASERLPLEDAIQ